MRDPEDRRLQFTVGDLVLIALIVLAVGTLTTVVRLSVRRHAPEPQQLEREEPYRKAH